MPITARKRNNMKPRIICLFSAALLLVACSRPENVFSIDTAAEGIPVQKTMYGLFYEDINFAADGGLYAEKVMNRSFEYDNPLQGWKTFGKVDVRDDGPFGRCPHYVRLSYAGHPARITGLENSGWFGIGVREGEKYRFSFWARTAGRESSERLAIFLCSPNTGEDVQMFGGAEIEVDSPMWKKYEVVLDSMRTESRAVLRIVLEGSDDFHSTSAVDLEHVSLFPGETFNGDPNGMRKDIAQALADIHPGLLRFPGGCIVEGNVLENRYQWKNSVGPVENRPLNLNRWSYCTFERLFPDYYQSYGIGFYELFRFAEEIGAEPLPVISCGMACQFQNDPAWPVNAPLDELQPYIQDALDLVEFANGPVDSKWGKVRADMGHPAPFGLKYLAIGNEQWGKAYPERLERFVAALRAKYPEIQLVGSSGPYLGGEWFDENWAEMRRLGCDLVDEHFYAPERFFEENADRYDDYPREGPKVFAGEYACHGTEGHKYNHFNAALVEAAFMTGLERNADVVTMSSYAPLLAHTDGWQWRPDLVWFDNLRVMRSESYWVQYLYSNNKGTRVLPLSMEGRPVAGKEGQNGLYASCVVDDATGEFIVKVANLSEEARSIRFDFGGKKFPACKRTSLHSDGRYDCNTIDSPDLIVPVETSVNPGRDVLGAKTFAVYRFTE